MILSALWFLAGCLSLMMGTFLHYSRWPAFPFVMAAVQFAMAFTNYRIARKSTAALSVDGRDETPEVSHG